MDFDKIFSDAGLNQQDITFNAFSNFDMLSCFTESNTGLYSEYRRNMLPGDAENVCLLIRNRSFRNGLYYYAVSPFIGCRVDSILDDDNLSTGSMRLWVTYAPIFLPK